MQETLGSIPSPAKQSSLFVLQKWDWSLLISIVFELLAGGVWGPMKSVLVCCFHKFNKEQKEYQKIDFLPGADGKGG